MDSTNSNYDDIDLPLPRGEACLVCRRRKVRCDGVRPKCGTCSRSGLQLSCEYHDTRYMDTIRRLEGQVTTLQTRLGGLQDSQPSGSSPDSSSPASSADSSNGGMAAPSPQALEAMLIIFARHKEQFGVPSATNADTLRAGPPALLEAACAIACHFAPPNLTFLHSFTSGFKMRAERALSAISSNANPSHTLARIQAHALLATLGLVSGCSVDGARHAGAAWQLAVSLRLHLIETPAATDAVCQQIETWWMVYKLDRAWSVLLGGPGQPSDTGVRTQFLSRGPGTQPPPHLQMLPSATDIAFDPNRETITSGLCKVLALHSAAYGMRNGGNAAVIGAMGTRLEQFLQCSAAAPVEHASARAIALGTLFHIRHLQNDVARALAAAQALAGTLGAIPEASYSLFHPIVAHSVARVMSTVQATPGAGALLPPQTRAMFGLAMQRFSQTLPFVNSQQE